MPAVDRLVSNPKDVRAWVSLTPAQRRAVAGLLESIAALIVEAAALVDNRPGPLEVAPASRSRHRGSLTLMTPRSKSRSSRRPRQP